MGIEGLGKSCRPSGLIAWRVDWWVAKYHFRRIASTAHTCHLDSTTLFVALMTTGALLKVREDEAPLVEGRDGETPGGGHAEAEGEGKGGQDRGRASGCFVPLPPGPRRLPTPPDRTAGLHHAHWRERCESRP